MEHWETVLFGFSYIHHLERSAEASVAELARRDSIERFMVELHETDSVKLEEAAKVRKALEGKVEAGEVEIKKQKRGKIWGWIGGALGGFGAGAVFGWVISR